MNDKIQDSQTYIKGKERPAGRAKKELELVYPSKWDFSSDHLRLPSEKWSEWSISEHKSPA